MGNKSIRKKQYIVDTAKQVFVEKGFKNVTMKDIVEKCDISRGGLYLYFGSTEAVFEEVIRQNSGGAEKFLENISEDTSAADLLLLFLKEQKNSILQSEEALTQAAYEYYFARKTGEGETNVLREQFEISVQTLEKLLEKGMDGGEFTCRDIPETAKAIMYQIEGMRIMAQTFHITEESIEQQILWILHSLHCNPDTK